MTIIAHIYVEWRLTSKTRAKFDELASEFEQVEDSSDEAEGIIEQIKLLPGFPHQAPMDSDFLFVITDHLH